MKEDERLESNALEIACGGCVVRDGVHYDTEAEANGAFDASSANAQSPGVPSETVTLRADAALDEASAFSPGVPRVDDPYGIAAVLANAFGPFAPNPLDVLTGLLVSPAMFVSPNVAPNVAAAPRGVAAFANIGVGVDFGVPSADGMSLLAAPLPFSSITAPLVPAAEARSAGASPASTFSAMGAHALAPTATVGARYVVK